MKASIIGRIRNTNLPRAKPLLPLFEAVVNSFHAIEEVRDLANPWIRIDAEREVLLENDRPGDFESFAVTDNGAGFNDENYDSFLTVDTQYKEALGGKGLGRFCWLKAFDRVEIESHYLEGDGLKRRAFEFRPAENSDEAKSAPSSESAPRTTVRLVGYRSPYKEGCPNELETVAQRLVENFLPFFLDPDCPRVLLTDGDIDISLNIFFEENVRSAESAHDLSVQGEQFSMRGFRLYNSSGRDHRVLYAAHHRGVVAERLDRHLPNLAGMIEDRDRGGFSYLAYVEGAKLDDSVNNERTGFAFTVSDDEGQGEDASQQDLFADGLSLKQIRQQVVRKVAEDLEPFLEGINQTKLTLINQYIDEEAPQYRPLRRYLSEFIDSIPPNPTNGNLERILHEQLYRKQRELRRESREIMEELAPSGNREEYRAKFQDFMERFNELGTSALAEYVLHRRIILDLFEKALQRDPDTGKYALEKEVHNIVFPMRTTSDDVPFEQQNLWIIDERLTYHSFLASDIPLSRVEPVDSDSERRPDILIFNRSLAFGDGEQPLSSIAMIEFKRPERDDYRNGNPISQVNNLILDIKDGKIKDASGRRIRVADAQIPAYAYIICDLTPGLLREIKLLGVNPTPDNEGFFGFNTSLNAYFEIISYDKLLRDALKRNRALFEKLNIPTGRVSNRT